jgi:hypothetical protein
VKFPIEKFKAPLALIRKLPKTVLSTIWLVPVIAYLFAAINPFQQRFLGLSQNRILNSDTLAFAEFSDSIISKLESPVGWYWGTHWFLFPDVILQGVNLSLGATFFSSSYSIGIINFFTFSYAVYLSSNKRVVVASTIACLFGMLGVFGFEPFSDLWLTGVHTFYMSAVVITVLTAKVCTFVKTRYFFIFLVSFSNELFFVAMTVQLVVMCGMYIFIGSIVEFYRDHLFRFRDLIVSGVGTVLGLLTLSNHYKSIWQFPPQRTNVKAALEYGTSNQLITLILAANLFFVLLFIGTAWKISNSSIFSENLSMPALIFAGLALSLFPLFSTNLPWVPRYGTLLMLFGLPLSIGHFDRLFGFRTDIASTLSVRKLVFITPILVSVAIGQIAKADFAVGTNEQCILNEMRLLAKKKDGLSVGAGYWDARRLRVLMQQQVKDSSVTFLPTDPSGEPYRWMSEKILATQTPFYILENQQSPWFSKDYLDSMSTLKSTCENYRIYVSSEPLKVELSLSNAFNYNNLTSVRLNETWYQPEVWGTWGRGVESYLDFTPISDTNIKTISLRVQALNYIGDWRRLSVSLNGEKLLKTFVLRANTISEISIPISTEDKESLSRDFRIVLQLDQSVIPARFSNSLDSRELGIGLISISIA